MSSAQIGAKNDSSVFWRGLRFPARENSPSVSRKRQAVLSLSWIVPRKPPLNSLLPKKVVDVKSAITIDAVEFPCGNPLGALLLGICTHYWVPVPNWPREHRF